MAVDRKTTYIWKPIISKHTFLQKGVTSSFIHNAVSNETIGENTLYNTCIATQRHVLAYGFLSCPWGSILTGEKFKVIFDVQPLPLPHTAKASVLLLAPNLACPGQRRVRWIQKHFPHFVFTLPSNSYLTPGRARDTVPPVLSQHLSRTPRAVYLPDKVCQQGEYMFQVSPYLNGKFFRNFWDTLSVMKY